MTQGQRCQCGHTRDQHSEWTTTAGCLACISCAAAAGPHVLARCECSAYTPAANTAPTLASSSGHFAANQPSDPCQCGHARDEHPANACVAILAVHERTEFCRCGAFELDEVSIAAATA